jgi:cysteine desulfurase
LKRLIYLDNAATTGPTEQVVAAVTNSMKEGYFNPSSLYSQGFSVSKSMDACRDNLKKMLSAKEVLFTSGGTEADNLAILGSIQSVRKRSRILYSAIEHPAVAEACRSLSARHEVLKLPVKPDGLLDLDAARKLITADTALICVMQVNNEVGSLQPLEEVVRLRDERCPDAHLHVDGVQGFLHHPFRLTDGIDSYVLSGHKIHGPKGIGVLALGFKARIKPILFGGVQEGGVRSGTENTAGIAGLDAAIKSYPSKNEIRILKLKLYEELTSRIPDARVNGPHPAAAAACDHILNISFPPVSAQTFMHALEGRDVLVSHGAACSSRSGKPSRTLSAMGISPSLSNSAIRFSLSHQTSADEIDLAVEACVQVYQSLRIYTRR